MLNSLLNLLIIAKPGLIQRYEWIDSTTYSGSEFVIIGGYENGII